MTENSGVVDVDQPTQPTSDYPLRVLVCGGRDYADRAKVFATLDELKIDALCHGAARGADSIADDWACLRGMPDVHAYPADWRRHGKRAGILRNQFMLDDFQPDLVIAFPGGRGTAHMVSIARVGGVEVLEVPGDR